MTIERGTLLALRAPALPPRHEASVLTRQAAAQAERAFDGPSPRDAAKALREAAQKLLRASDLLHMTPPAGKGAA